MTHKGTTPIETKRLILRRFQKEDAPHMYRNWASDPEVTKFLTWPTHQNADVTAQVIERWIGGYSDPQKYLWAIEWKESTEPIGSISAVKVNDETQSVTIGYCISRAFWGKGVTPQALRAVIAYFFEEVGVNCINACHDPRNPNSGKVMRKCGMTYEGTRRAGGVSNQGIFDQCWHSILRKEYEESKEQKWMIREITDGPEKAALSRRILEALPEWFGIPQAREDYIRESAEQLFFAAYSRENDPIGFLCLKETGRETVEISVMGVLKEYHRQGAGRELVRAAKRQAAFKGYLFLQVKTVRMGCYEDYDRTNRFYQSMGFKELEVIPALWGEENPCQIYIMNANG